MMRGAKLAAPNNLQLKKNLQIINIPSKNLFTSTNSSIGFQLFEL